MFRRTIDGTLIPAGTIPTGGRGTGNLLENQGALILSKGHEWLFAANPGSDDISVFSVQGNGNLVLIDRIGSGGDRPVSLTVSEDVLYVLNAGSAGNITGFIIHPDGKLSQLTQSSRPLSTTASETCPEVVRDFGDPGAVCSVAGPTTVGFNPNGDVLVVSERLTNRIDTWTLGDNALATLSTRFQEPANSTPFGFAFGQRGRFVIANSFLDLPGLGAASSFVLSAAGSLTPKTQTLGNGNASSCWTLITNNGRVAFTSNPVAKTLSSYNLENDGTLSILNPIAASIPDGDPRDLDASETGRFYTS